MPLELVVNNPPKPPPAPPTDSELRALAQSALVRAAKKAPLRAILILDLGGGEVCTLSTGLDRANALKLAGVGVKDMQEHL